MKLTFISDTHTKHRNLVLNGGDLLIHAGDIMNTGLNKNEIINFLSWFADQPYNHKIFIAGNHDWYFQRHSDEVKSLLETFEGELTYLEDSGTVFGGQNIWGSPWQPEFNDWAFNLPRNGKELEEKWSMIPEDVDILISHCPPYGTLDRSSFSPIPLGCEVLSERLKVVKPKIHVFGHIHHSYGYVTDGSCHYFNASMLCDNYIYKHKPLNIEWDPNLNELEFV